MGLGLLFAVGTATLVWAPAVRAQQAGSPGDAADGPRYRQLVTSAVKAFQESDYPQARSLFERAHAIDPSARTLRGLGFVAFEERNYVDTIQFLKQALAETHKPLTASQREEVQEVLERSDAYVARCVLDLVPVDAELLVDGKAPVYDEGTLLLDPGFHEITASAQGNQVTRSVNLEPNESLMLRISVLGSAAADDNQAALQPEPETAPPAQTIFPKKQRGIGARRGVGIAVAALGVAGLASSLALTLKAVSFRDSSLCIDGRCPTPDHKSRYDQAVVFSKAATVTAAVGGVAFVTGALLAVWPSRERRDGVALSTRVVPQLSPSFAGVSVGGKW